MQETGRAGRDGKQATCVLYYGYQDAVKMRHMLQESAKENNTSPEQQQRNTESVNTMVKSATPTTWTSKAHASEPIQQTLKSTQSFKSSKVNALISCWYLLSVRSSLAPEGFLSL